MGLRPKTITIGGRRYNFVIGDCGVENGEPAAGHCDPPSRMHKRIIVVPKVWHGGDSRDGSYVLCQILLHEFFHAADWNQAEKWVYKAAKSIATTLYEEGLERYVRRQPPNPWLTQRLTRLIAAADTNQDEAWVKQAAEDFSKALLRFGYSRR